MHRKLNVIVIAGILVALVGVGTSSVAFAGPLDPPTGPASTNAYTLDQLWNRLSSGTAGTPSTFAEPSSGPGTSTMHTLDEIMAVAPAVDANGASAAEVVSGKKFWGLTTGGWGVKTGTAALGSHVSGVNGSLTFAIPDGFYTGKTATAQDTDLTAGNIRQGANIFGVAGSLHRGERDCRSRGGLIWQDVFQCERGGDREHAEQRRREPDAWDHGPDDRGGLS